MLTKNVYFILVCLIMLPIPLYFPSSIQAAPSNVMECMEEGGNCEELDTQENELNSQNEDFLIESSRGGGGSLFIEIIKLFFALILVLALIYIVLKLVNNKNKLSTQGKVLDNLAGISLGHNKSLQIIRIGSKFYLVGVGDNVELLDEILDEDIQKELLNRKNGSDPNTFITSILPSKTDNSNKKDFKHLFSNELEKLKQNRKDLIKQQKEEKHG